MVVYITAFARCHIQSYLHCSQCIHCSYDLKENQTHDLWTSNTMLNQFNCRSTLALNWQYTSAFIFVFLSLFLSFWSVSFKSSLYLLNQRVLLTILCCSRSAECLNDSVLKFSSLLIYTKASHLGLREPITHCYIVHLKFDVNYSLFRTWHAVLKHNRPASKAWMHLRERPLQCVFVFVCVWMCLSHPLRHMVVWVAALLIVQELNSSNMGLLYSRKLCETRVLCLAAQNSQPHS